MALPSSGQLSIRDINTEIGRLPVQTSLDGLENGTYVAINTNSRATPNSANPAAISEWYSYNHGAGGGPGTRLTLINLGYSGRAEASNIGPIEACSEFSSDNVPTYYDSSRGDWFTTNIFADSAGNIFAQAGWYSDQPYASGFTVRYWRGSSWSTEASLCSL